MKTCVKKLTALLLVMCLFATMVPVAFAYSTIRSGSKGSDVKTMQTMLNKVMNAGLTVDGICGSKSVAAVKAFQSANGLSVDGVCGPKTWAALESKYNAQSAAAKVESKCSVKFYSNGGNYSYKAVFLEKDTSYVIKASYTPKRDGHTFLGWATVQTASAPQYYEGSTLHITGDITLYAVWQKNVSTPCSFDIGSGNYAPGTLKQGSSYSISGTVTSTHKLSSVTVGVYYTSGSATAQVKTANPDAASYNINKLDNSIKFGKLAAGDYVLKVTAVDACGTGKTLVSSNFRVEGAQEEKNNAGTEETESVLLCEYRATMYAAIDNVAVRTQPYAKSGTLAWVLAKNTPVQVVGYLINSAGNKWYKLDNGKFVYSERLTLTKPKQYTLSFHGNGANVSGVPGSVNAYEGQKARITTEVPSQQGYSFLGWAKSKNATTKDYAPGSAVTMTANMTLYAVWAESRALDELFNEMLKYSNMTYAECKNAGLDMPWTIKQQTNAGHGWCNAFIYTCAEKVGLSEAIPRGGVEAMFRRILENGGTAVTDPEPGDIVFFNWDGSKFNSRKGWNHVGIVYKVLNGKITVIHGNYHSSKVGHNCSRTWVCAPGCTHCGKAGATFDVDDTKICAYARPAYS